MLTEEDEVDITAMFKAGWTISAISRHTGRDRKTVRRVVAGHKVGQRRQPSALEPYRAYIAARLEVATGDPHLDASVLLRELRPLGFERSYATLTRELRRLALRPVCLACSRESAATIEILHPPGDELQLDWKGPLQTAWGEPAYLLVGALPYSGTIRAQLTDGISTGHLVDALDRLLRQLGGTPQAWRVDRMQGAVVPATDRLCAAFAEAAKHYGAAVRICPPRRPQRKGSVEAAVRYVTRSCWRTLTATTPAEAQHALDRWAVTVADQRTRHGITVAERAATEPLRALPATAFPALLEVERVVSRAALVSFNTNQYSVSPRLIGETVRVVHRLGSRSVELRTLAGTLAATHQLAPRGAGQIIRLDTHRVALEDAVLGAFTTAPACRSRPQRPPSAAARAIATAQLAASATITIEQPSLEHYAAIGAVAR